MNRKNLNELLTRIPISGKIHPSKHELQRFRKLVTKGGALYESSQIWLIGMGKMWDLFVAGCSKAKYSTRDWLDRFVFRSGATVAATTFIALYFSAIDTWKDKWEIFSEYPIFHDYAFRFLLGMSMIIVCGQWLHDNRNRKSLDKTEELLSSFVKMVGSIVSHKINRFRSRAATLTTKKFEHITLPTEQIELIFSESAAFLERVYSLDEKDLDINILSKDPNNNWLFLATLRQWKHGNPEDLATGNTAANRALLSGQFEFIPSKKYAARENRYVLSDRDKENGGDGSIFCYPVSVDCKGNNYKYIACIVTYHKRLCDQGDHANIKKTEALLREICRRIEVELLLRTIKTS